MNKTSKQLRIAIFQERVEPYRFRFFDELHRCLSEAGIEMTLWVQEDRKTENQLRMPYLRILKCYRICGIVWERLPKQLCEADLLIMPQQSRHLASLTCLLWRKFRGKQNAFWGHGRCFDPRFEKRLSEKLKRWFSVRVDWWFAYNDLSARIVQGLGFPQEKITSVINSTDTEELRREYKAVIEEGLDVWRARLGLGSGPIGVFTGRLYFNKQINFLIEAAQKIREQVPDFELVVIGDGPDRVVVENAARTNPWIHFPGWKNNQEKVPYWALADVLMNPGAVGLVLIEGFAIGLPMMTTDHPTHGPEIDHLQHGRNGLMSSPWGDVLPYAEMVANLLNQPTQLAMMKNFAIADGAIFSAETMARNFSRGILSVLNSTTLTPT